MLEEGDQIRDYTLRRFLGQGSYGEVWLAEKKIELADECIPFALKFLIGQGDRSSNPEGVKNEVRTWIRAGNHFNIVPVYDGFIHGRFLVIASEYVEGGSLRDWLVANDGKAPSLGEAVDMMRGILRGLTHLHSRKIIHRDLKPENILIKDGAPKITDFGVSRMVETSSQSAVLRRTRGAGAPLYMPPEAFNDGSPMPQLDTWSAGVLFYEMLSGEFPFNADTLTALFGEITNKEPRLLPAEIEGLQEFISRSLTKDVLRRFQTAQEMVLALDLAWTEMEQRLKWKLETIAEEAPRRRDGQIPDEDHQPMHAGDLNRHRKSEIRYTQSVGAVGSSERKVKQEIRVPASQVQPIKSEAVKRIERLRRFHKWIVIVGFMIAIMGAGIWWSSKRLFLNRGKECYGKKDYDCAVYNYTKAIWLNPLAAEVYYSRGRANNKKGDFDQGIKDLSKAIELNAQNSDAYTYRGAAYGAKGNPDEAVKDLNRAIELNPQSYDAYFNRGVAYRSKGDRNQAIKDFDKAIELNPTYINAYYERGSTYFDGGNRNQAIKDFDKAVALDPQYAEAYKDIGAVYVFRGDFEQAVKTLDKAIELTGTLAGAYYYRGLAYVNMRRYDEAIRDFSSAIGLNSQMTEAYAYRGFAYSSRGGIGDLDLALGDSKRARELNPQSAEVYYIRGLAYGQSGNHDQAVREFNKAIDLDPQNPHYYYSRSVAFKSLGKLSESKADFETFRKLSSM